MMSFWVVPWSAPAVDAVLLGHGHVEREQPGGRGVDRHRRVHLVERDAVEQRVHVALVGDRDADLAHLAARQLVVGVVARLGGEVERHRQAGLALGEVLAVELVRLARRGVARVGAHHPGAVRAPGADVRTRSHRGLYVRDPREPRNRRHAPGQRPRDLRLRGGRHDRRPGPTSCLDTLLDALGPVEPRGPAAHPHPPRPRRAPPARSPGASPTSRCTSTSAARPTWSTRRSCSRAPPGSTATTWTGSGATSSRCPRTACAR